ncbi:hypothetical protein L0Y59_05215 [Candidatus Uhrbacteria bacterium]|nr:hypothetical protein [Candidatus Uhrbacteria bacterium]
MRSTHPKPKEQAQARPKASSGLLKKFFIALGVMFAALILLVIGAIVALVLVKPYGIDITAAFKADKGVPYDHPMLSPEQEQTLQNLGVDPAVLPTSITPEQTQCAVEVLGQARASEILGGATPSVTEILFLKKCL